MYITHTTFASVTLADIVRSLPADPASLVALVLLVVFVGGVVWFGTRSS